MGKLSWSKSYCYRYNHSNRFRNRNHKTVERGAVGVRPGSGRTPKEVSVRLLGKEWQKYIFDVCGIGFFNKIQERSVFITHLHKDHLPLKEYVAGAKIRFLTAKNYVDAVKRKYGDKFEVEEYTDVIRAEHSFFFAGRYRTTEAYIYFIKNAILVPECNNPAELIDQYGAGMAFIFAFRQSRSHLTDFNNHRRDVFILDNKSWKAYRPNVIPKILWSSSQEDRKIYSQYCSKKAWENV